MGRVVPSVLSDILKYVTANPYRIPGLTFRLLESIYRRRQYTLRWNLPTIRAREDFYIT
jgi:hypothetical protein